MNALCAEDSAGSPAIRMAKANAAGGGGTRDPSLSSVESSSMTPNEEKEDDIQILN